MKLENGTFCPLIRENCMGLKCAWFLKMRGQDKNTGQDVDEYFCAMTALPMLLIENTQTQRESGAAIESFRNEMVRDNEVMRRLTAIGLAQSNGLLPKASENGGSS